MPLTLFGETGLQPPPRAGAYQVLYIDFPWPEQGAGQTKRGADRHYDLMSVGEILDLSFTIGRWAAPHAHMYSWATNNYLPAAIEAIRASGFRYVTTVTWVKDRMGLGQYFRGKTEHCLFAVRGRLPYRVRDDNGKRAQGETVLYEPLPDVDEHPEPVDLPSAFEARRGQHSAKPEQMRQYIELVSGPLCRLELFARRPAPGWDLWGNQAPTTEGA